MIKEITNPYAEHEALFPILNVSSFKELYNLICHSCGRRFGVHSSSSNACPDGEGTYLKSHFSFKFPDIHQIPSYTLKRDIE